MDKDTGIPADQGLQRYSKGINKKYDASVFETLAILDNTEVDPVTGVARPSDERVMDAKIWVDENRL
jgi:hypothetical protein